MSCVRQNICNPCQLWYFIYHGSFFVVAVVLRVCIRGSIRFLGLGLIEINCHWEFTSCKLILNKVAKFCCVTDDVVRHCLVVIRAGRDWLLLSMYACGNMFCLRFCDLHYSGRKKLLPRWTVQPSIFSYFYSVVKRAEGIARELNASAKEETLQGRG